MKAEIITIGDELLIGQTIDTNSAWMGSELSLAGFDIHKKTTVHDNNSDILKALSDAAGKTDVVLITGGLGPTSASGVPGSSTARSRTPSVTTPGASKRWSKAVSETSR